MAIETAIVAPVLLLMSLGAFQISAVVARQNELQSAAAEAEAIALAAPLVENTTIKSIIMASAGLSPDQVTVNTVYRCSNDEDFTTHPESCASAAETSTFLKIYMTDTYAPRWVQFGLGETLTYHVTRTVQLS